MELARLATYLAESVPEFLAVAARMAGIFGTAPVLGGRNVPIPLKIAVSCLTAAMLLPFIGTRVPMAVDSTLAYAFLLAREAIIGMVLGFVVALTLAAIQVAGQLIDMQMGFGIVNVIDPMYGTQVPLIGNFQHLLAMLFFLMFNGHHALLSATVRSFDIIPIGGAVFSAALLDGAVRMLGGVFVMGIKIAAPVVGAMFLADVALGILARTVPQMNVFVLGLPLKIILGLAVLVVSLPLYFVLTRALLDGAVENLFTALRGMAR